MTARLTDESIEKAAERTISNVVPIMAPGEVRYGRAGFIDGAHWAMNELEARKHVERCPICGTDYDRRDLSQVMVHMSDPHEPVGVSDEPIFGTKIGDVINGETWYTGDYIAILKRQIDEGKARLAEAISLMKEVAPAIDLISVTLSERFDRFLAICAKEDKP